MYVVRHGETDWNAEGRIQGHHQSHLNDLGRRQARAAAAYLAGCGLTHIYSSDLARASDTAAAVSDLTNLPVVTDPALRERDFGPLSGSLIVDAVRVRDAAPKNEADPSEWSGVDGVESDSRMSERLWGFLRPMAERHVGQTVLVVTHGGVLRLLLCAVLGIPAGKPWRAILANAAVNLFEVRSGIWRLRSFGIEPPAV